MVNTLLSSMMMLTDVLILFIFFLAVMALIGLQLFTGELKHKCVLNPPQNLTISYQNYILNESEYSVLSDNFLLHSDGLVYYLFTY